MGRLKSVLLFTLLICVTPFTALAQDCPVIVESALAAADQICTGIGRNQACYGNVLIHAEPQPDVQNFTFTQSGDIVDVGLIRTMELTPMDTAAGTWGVAVMKLQANIPDTLPGENVTFLMFGDVEITNAADPTAGQNPMQAFYLRTGIGDAGCEEAPSSGLIVQTPAGVSEVTLTVNEVNVTMGSTIMFRTGEDAMEISALEGAAVTEVDGATQTVVAGTWLEVPMVSASDSDSQPDGTEPTPFFGIVTPEAQELQQSQVMRPAGPPGPPQSYADDRIQGLPIQLLEREIEVAPSLSAEEVLILRERVAIGLLPCDFGPLPACEELPPSALATAEPAS